MVELAQGLTPAMKAIQKAVLVCMDDCLKELKRVTTLSLEGGEQLSRQGQWGDVVFGNRIAGSLVPASHRPSRARSA